ncbi:MAG: EAL domain-containing protein [Burkholderiales bacterium]
MSLRARVLFLVLAAALLPLMVLAWLFAELRSAKIEEAREQVVVRAVGIAEDLESTIAGTSQLLFGLSHVPLLATSNREACSRFLGAVLKEHPQYTGILTILPNGRLFCDSLRSGRELILTDRDYFQRAPKTSGHVVEPVFGRLTGLAVLQIAYAVRDAEGALRYVLLASLNLDQYGRNVSRTLPYRGMTFRIWDRQGRVIVRRAAREEASSAMDVVDDAGRKRVMMSAPGDSWVQASGDGAHIWIASALPRTPDTGLRLTLDVPATELRSYADTQLRNVFLLLVIASIAVIVGAVVLAEFAIRRQAQRVTAAISRLDAGNFKTPIGAPYPGGELGDVMAALDRLAVSLDTQRDDIGRFHQELERQANYDALTGLANRNLLMDRLAQSSIHARRAGRLAAVLVMDLDRFKTVNDSLGHSHGDLLLREVARRLQACVREGDTVARLGGDEFVVVLADLAAVGDVVPLARKILAAVAQPTRLGGQELNAGVSIGVSIYPRDGAGADELLRNADTAMYRAKEQGGASVEFFTAEMNREAVQRLQIEAGLRHALEHGELLLEYQPIIELASGRIASAEALVRWRHPQRGLVPPGQFISIAEETGLIVPIGEWVLRAACAQVRAWEAQGVPAVPVAVNLSARQFRDAGLAELVAGILRESGCPPSALQLELTESALMQHPDQALAAMRRINDLGVRLSIDDFGTGYSSLSYLKQFPVHKLKIDRSFVRDLVADASDDAIAGAIVALAKKLGLCTVAEGVETQEQLERLAALGCDEYQGFLFAAPCPAEDFARLLGANHAARKEAQAT